MEIYTESVETQNIFQMTRFPHDQFAKDYLKELLTPLGVVETSRSVAAEVREISEADLPWLWILTPTASVSILNGFRATGDERWPPGVYFQGEHHKTAIIVIHQLPRTPDTLWVRILGKGNVQQQAIRELNALSVDHPSRSEALLLLANLRTTLQVSQNVNKEDQELIMELSPVLVQQLETATQTGIQTGNRTTIENMMRLRYGVLDEQLSAIIPVILELPVEDFSRLLLQLSNLSREDLLAQFRR